MSLSGRFRRWRTPTRPEMSLLLCFSYRSAYSITRRTASTSRTWLFDSRLRTFYTAHRHTRSTFSKGTEQIHTIKLLGVTFSDNLSFAPHIDNTLRSVSQRFYLVKQLKIRDLNQAALDIVFHSLVLNQLTYASQCFSGYLLEQHIDGLQAILNKAKK